MKPDYTLMLCTDRSYLKDSDFFEVITGAVAGGVTIVQLREKDLDSRAFYELAKALKTLTDRLHVPLLINDRLDIALAVDAAGVHLGQSDLPGSAARRLLGPEKLLGLSAATLDEAQQAKRDGADYLGIGAMFPTATKPDARAVSRKTLEDIRQLVSLPSVVIGGINRQTAGQFKDLTDGLAVVSDLMASDNPAQSARELIENFKRGQYE